MKGEFARKRRVAMFADKKGEIIVHLDFLETACRLVPERTSLMKYLNIMQDSMLATTFAWVSKQK
jgi:hypothetical protein